MVCVAAFIILLLVGIVVAFISIFNRDFGRKYLKLLKKSFHCFGKRVRLQKCDTNFSDDVKTTLLKKIVIKKPHLVKPLSIVIEIASVLIIIITVWSIVEAAKAGLALWTLGTCNVSQPSNCALGAESCSLEETDLNWFEEWGEIFRNIPERLKHWDVAKLTQENPDLSFAFTLGDNDSAPALSIIDPGCSVCLQSYKNIQNNPDFLNNHKIQVLIYPIKNPSGDYRFANSELIAKYILATNHVTKNTDISEKIINRIFTEFDKDYTNYQEVFNNQLSNNQAATLLDSWLKEWKVSSEDIKSIKTTVNLPEIAQQLDYNRAFVENIIKPKGIPTFIFDGKRHLGLIK